MWPKRGVASAGLSRFTNIVWTCLGLQYRVASKKDNWELMHKNSKMGDNWGLDQMIVKWGFGGLWLPQRKRPLLLRKLGILYKY